MLKNKAEKPENITPMTTIDGAVGIPTKNDAEDCKWFVALVKSNREKVCKNLLEGYGYDIYIPLQKEVRTSPSGRRRIVERLVMPGYVFIRCTEKRRMEIFTTYKATTTIYISRFLVDKASKPNKFGTKALATISDNDIKRLEYMIGNSDTPVTIEDAPVRVGDTICVLRGKLAGFKGELQEINGETKLIIRIHGLGAAKVTLKRSDVELVK